VFQECDKERNISFDVGNLQQIVWRNFRFWNFCIWGIKRALSSKALSIKVNILKYC
jgi:hypothetical protein